MLNYKEIYYNKLNEEDQKALDLFSEEKYSFSKAFQKAFYPKKLRRRWIYDMMLRMVFILGIL